MMTVDRNRNRLVLYGNNFRVCVKIIVDGNNVRCVSFSGFNYGGRCGHLSAGLCQVSDTFLLGVATQIKRVSLL